MNMESEATPCATAAAPAAAARNYSNMNLPAEVFSHRFPLPPASPLSQKSPKAIPILF